jgi:transposase
MRQRKSARAGRQPLPDHLERVVHLHESDSCTCGQCGSALVKIGEDITQQLMWSRRVSLCTVTSVHSTLAVLAKP